METLATAAMRPLTWIQPKTFERRYELRTADGGLVATLVFATAFGSLATAASADGTWTFKRVGFFNPRVTVRETGEESDVAVFYPRMLSGGTLETHEGTCRWESTNFWGTRWAFFDAEGAEVVSFSPGVEKPKLSDAFKTQASVQINAPGHSPAKTALLVMLGWYLMILRQEETATVVGATAASS